MLTKFIKSADKIAEVCWHEDMARKEKERPAIMAAVRAMIEKNLNDPPKISEVGSSDSLQVDQNE